MTEELFHRAVSGVMQQGCLSKNLETGFCYYRHPDDPNIRCALGHLIPDDVYTEDMEGNSARGLRIRFNFELPPWAATLQQCHDDSLDTNHFLRKASSLALQLGFKIP